MLQIEFPISVFGFDKELKLKNVMRVCEKNVQCVNNRRKQGAVIVLKSSSSSAASAPTTLTSQ